MNGKEIATICLFCTKSECNGEVECFRERKREYMNRCARDRQRGERALNYICNKEYSTARNEARKKAINRERTVRNCRGTVE